ncbi:hypothetical protein L9F63_016491 [Diploptera punctata]|uniref:C-type lectin domain-containing protein n=1 Tax=Diploptera punctata TaxID=6984 RepID=A0AAD8A1N1_DIPPU|nr:hypothetical protein L9F63_016491 [Diploptera punctata]
MCWCLCFFILITGVYTTFQGHSHISNNLKFSIVSRRNSTGHWIAQVELKHGAESKEAGPWEVDVDQTTTKYGDFETIVIAAEIAAPPRGIATKLLEPPQDYKHLPSQGFYKFHRDQSTWLVARLKCEEEGTHLAIINSPREALAVTSLWVREPKLFNDWRDDWAFIGFHDLYDEGQYVTVFNQSLQDAGYATWFKGEPDGEMSQNCGLININSQLGTIFCSQKLPFICEYND